MPVDILIRQVPEAARDRFRAAAAARGLTQAAYLGRLLALIDSAPAMPIGEALAELGLAPVRI